MGGGGGAGVERHGDIWRDMDVHCNVPINGFSQGGKGVGRPRGIEKSEFPRPTPGHIVNANVSMLHLNFPSSGPFQMSKFLLW